MAGACGNNGFVVVDGLRNYFCDVYSSGNLQEKQGFREKNRFQYIVSTIMALEPSKEATTHEISALSMFVPSSI